MNAQSYELWHEQFAPILRRGERWDAFDRIALHLSRTKEPVILETAVEIDRLGTTPVWNWWADKYDARVFTLDPVEEKIEIARKNCEKITAIHVRPVEWIRNMTKPKSTGPVFMGTVDVLYLHFTDDQMSSAQFAAAWAALKSGCLVAAEDPSNKEAIDRYFGYLGVRPMLQGTVNIWKNP